MVQLKSFFRVHVLRVSARNHLTCTLYSHDVRLPRDLALPSELAVQVGL